jgi:hypothetical protein
MSVIRRLTNVAKGKVKEWRRVWRDGPGEDHPEVEEPPRPKKPPVEEPPAKEEDAPKPIQEPEPTPRKRRL